MKQFLQLSLTFIFLFFSVITQAQNPGSLDTSFEIGTGMIASSGNIALQSDGKIFVTGRFSGNNGQNQYKILRLNSDGSTDTSFDIGTGFNSFVSAIVIQPDGKILVGGSFTTYNGQNQNRILRLNTDGSKDTSFDIGTGFPGFYNDVYTIALQPDGKILLGGRFTYFNAQIHNRILRLNSDGSLDTSFNIGSGFNNIVSTIVLQSDGKILVGGSFSSYNGQTHNRILRLNSDGSVDNSFEIGTGMNGSAIIITLQLDGKILIGGLFYQFNGQATNNIARLNLDGSLDNSFDIGTGFNSNFGGVYEITVQPDNKIMVGGSFTEYNGQNRNCLVRLNADGNLDTSFDIGTGFSDFSDIGVQSIIMQSDGKLLVGGYFSEYNNQLINKIIRLHNDEALNLEDLDNNDRIKLYPNPVKDMLFLNKEVKKVTVTDLTGKVLAIHNSSSQIDMSSFQRGVYLIVMETENNLKETRKIVKE
jgi:uncharacterized delta-60 repeat protein